MKRVTVTMHDVARLAGVSQTTVSLILNQSGSASFSQETVNRVYAAAAQLNYKAKRPITQGPRPKTVMVLMANVTNPYYTAMLSSIEDVCYAQGYKVVSCCTYHDTESEKLYMEMAVSNNYPGVILLSPPDNPAAFAEVSAKIPVVTICDRISNLETDIIELNNCLAGRLAAEHLHALGHQRIAVLTSPLKRNTARTERLNGLKAYFAQHLPDNDLVLCIENNSEADNLAERLNDYHAGYLLAQNEKLRGEVRRLEQAARRTAVWSDRVEGSKYHSENAGLKVDRGFVGHKAAKMMKRSKAIAARQEAALEEKKGLLKDLERTEDLKLSPVRHHSSRLLELRDVCVFYGEKQACGGVSFTLNRGDRLCLAGGNGCGKTSLLRLALGEEMTYTGTLWRASGLEISYVPQRADHLAGSLLEFAERQGIARTQFLTILRKMDVSRALFERDMAEYSAGQQKKVLLAMSLCQHAHLYVWDEPLNYIDLFSRIQIEDLILEYQPTLLFVEHDLAFQRRTATQVLQLDRA